MNSLLQNINGNYHVQRSLTGIPVMNQKQPNETPHLNLLIQPFAWSSNHYGAAQLVQWLRYMLKDLEFKSWQKQENYIFTKTPGPSPAPTQPPTQWKPQLFLWQKSGQSRQSDHYHLSRAKLTNQWSYTFTQSVSLHGTQWGNSILPSLPTYVHLFWEVTSFLVL